MRRLDWLLGGVSILLAACASAPPPPAAGPAAVHSNTNPAAAPSSSESSMPSVTAAQLVGVWTQYWAPCGSADTQRYVFLADGRFGWLAAAHEPTSSPLQQSGHYEVNSGMLVLQVERERFAACETCASQAGANQAGRIVTHSPALSLSIELGVCPQNAEAQQLDTDYTCFGIGGHAFWHHPQADTGDVTAYFE